MRPRHDPQRGFTLLEAMISLAIAALIGVVVARIANFTMTAWFYGSSGIISQQKARVARNNVLRNLRQARASTVMIHNFAFNNAVNPPMSMVSFIDVNGNSLAFWQNGQKLFQGRWWLDGLGQRCTSSAEVIIPGKLERFQAYYPDLKNPKTVSFSIYTAWVLDRSPNPKLKPQIIQLAGTADIRDP